jgi:hypothetical protein
VSGIARDSVPEAAHRARQHSFVVSYSAAFTDSTEISFSFEPPPARPSPQRQCALTQFTDRPCSAGMRRPKRESRAPRGKA